nr:SUMF1/EgtB/PvdO family nonheme iron enzyme [uncultured Methanomethylovorans sp.]
MSVINESPNIIADVMLDFMFDEKLLHIAEHDDCFVRNGKFLLGNIYGGKSTSFTVLFEPLKCTTASDIRCQVSYADHNGDMASVWMKPKEISVTCPIMKTDSDINIGRLKEFIEDLPVRDSRICEVLSGFDIVKLASLAREVVERQEVRHVRTLYTRDGNTCEIWYYGKIKVNRDDIVFRVSILNTYHTVELFAATQTAKSLTGFLAEVGRGLKDAIESKVSGKGRVINLSINKSRIDRSNLIDLCSMDGTCDVNIVIDKSDIDRSSIGFANEDESLSNQNDSNGVTGNRECPFCFNLIDSSNKSLLCKCGARFCQTCEGWFREPRKPGERPLCKSCFTEQQERLAREREETARLKAAEEERQRLEQEELERLRKEEERKVQEAAHLKAAEEAERKRKEEERLRREREEAAKKPSASIKNSIGMDFVLIPAGEFQMGSDDGYDSEKPVHKVKISRPFYLGKYEVTQAQWVAIMGDNPSYFKGDNNPVENVSWNDVQEFVKKLNAKEGTDKYPLPSEAEWEYACRAGTTTIYSFGDDESKLAEYAWYGDNSGNKTHPVGQKKPNPWGLYDMHGNIREWCQDEWHGYYKGAPTDGSAWVDGSSPGRIVRGGGWNFFAGSCRSAVRSNNDPDYRSFFHGFRLLRAV